MWKTRVGPLSHASVSMFGGRAAPEIGNAENGPTLSMRFGVCPSDPAESRSRNRARRPGAWMQVRHRHSLHSRLGGRCLRDTARFVHRPIAAD
jgi:hypothetical protein